MSGGPDFIGIGVQKCGTTWIGDILSQHPDVLFKKKEVDFFERNFHRGYSWYHEFFADRGQRKAGEITPNYIITPRPDPSRKQFYPKWFPRHRLQFWRRRPSALEEIRKHYPNVKLFAMFRNPIERAWSHYWMWRNRKERIGKRIATFEQMFQDDGRWIRMQGFYDQLLPVWRAAFPEMGLFFHDDLKRDAAELARNVYRCVGVDENFVPETKKEVNKGRYEKMPGETREMLRATYRDSVLRFSDIVGRDLSAWVEQPVLS